MAAATGSSNPGSGRAFGPVFVSSGVVLPCTVAAHALWPAAVDLGFAPGAPPADRYGGGGDGAAGLGSGDGAVLERRSACDWLLSERGGAWRFSRGVHSATPSIS